MSKDYNHERTYMKHTNIESLIGEYEFMDVIIGKKSIGYEELLATVTEHETSYSRPVLINLFRYFNSCPWDELPITAKMNLIIIMLVLNNSTNIRFAEMIGEQQPYFNTRTWSNVINRIEMRWVVLSNGGFDND